MRTTFTPTQTFKRGSHSEDFIITEHVFGKLKRNVYRSCFVVCGDWPERTEGKRNSKEWDCHTESKICYRAGKLILSRADLTRIYCSSLAHDATPGQSKCWKWKCDNFKNKPKPVVFMYQTTSTNESLLNVELKLRSAIFLTAYLFIVCFKRK